MTKHIRYAKYVLRHKWYVFIACCRLGIPWQGITHDLSKFRPSEWGPYAEYFYGKHRITAPCVTEAFFDEAWLFHQHRNPHHWQYWLLREDSSPDIKIMHMPDKYRREMLADWRGAGRAITGKDDTLTWYTKNKDRMTLHYTTREWIEDQLRFGPYSLKQVLDIGQDDYDRSQVKT
ncbi:MAG: hypothetical protein HYY29_03725 [Chloroflexi bacterium]|nr:hypothetical protein [Chloroflexota bacterium]